MSSDRMDHGIHFGEVSSSPPERRLRPDRNGQYRVVDIGELSASDLPIFVDLDCLRDIELHAGSDTSVELGGVLLGGQFEDEEGRPFVVVSDSVRAEHFEATKGSFKFTHETWAQITKQRNEFPADLQMVGWYHTHPDWGVFLSGMDMFICENFFQRPLDLALVVDPCRRDRGFFVWTQIQHSPIQRTGGFTVYASRHRQAELLEIAAELEEPSMSTELRRTNVGRGMVQGTPSIHVAAGLNAWHSWALIGMLAIQFCFIALLSYRVLVVGAKSDANGSVTTDQLIQRLELDRQLSEVQAEKRILDKLASNWDGTPRHLVESLTEQQKKIEELEGHLAAHKSRERELETTGSQAREEARRLTEREAVLTRNVQRLEEKLTELKSDNRKQQALIASLRGESEQASSAGDQVAWYRRPLVWGISVALGVVGAVGYAYLSVSRSAENL